MVRTVGEASRFCVPTALAYLTGFSRQAVVIGLRDKIRATNYNGGYMHRDYIAWVKSLPKSLVELGEMRKGPICATQLPPGLWLVSGEVAGNSGAGHCFIVYNGLLFDNTFVGRPINNNYRCWKYYPVLNSQMNITIKKMAENYNQNLAA